MRFKAIVSDFDGTLVDGSLKLDKKVEDGIRKFINSGGIFSIATGRDYFGALKKICKNLGIYSPQIVRGGSEIISAKDHKVLWGRYIKEKDLSILLKFLHSRNDIYFAAERGKEIYTKNAEPKGIFGENAKFKDLDKIPLDNVPKVFLPASLNKPDIVLNLIEEVKEKFPTLSVTKTSYRHYFGMDINDGGVSKHLALLEYSKLMNLSPSEIIGVGDSYNDYPLLSACGYKVAMGNAPKELIEIADKVVGTQKENGILEVFKIYFS